MFCGTLKMPFSIIRAVNRSVFLQHVHSRSFNKQIGISQVKALSGTSCGQIWSPLLNPASLNLKVGKTSTGGSNCKFNTSAQSLGDGTSDDVVVYTGAFETPGPSVAGYGYWENNGPWFMDHWDRAIIYENPGIAWMGFFAIITSARKWGSQWENKSVNFKTDSLAAVDAWNHGRFRVNSMDILKRDLQMTASHYRFSVQLSHIRSDENVAEPLSRNEVVEFLDKNPTAAYFGTHLSNQLNLVIKQCNLPVKGIFRDLDKK